MEIDPTPITAWFALFIAIAATVSLITAALVWSNRRFENRVTSLIKETTYPIQPKTNGGFSLPDLHTKFDKMEITVKRIEDRYNEVIEQEELQRAQWHVMYLEDQKFHHGKLASVFVAIRKLLHIQDIEEQVKEWDNITEAYLDGTIIEKYPDERNGDGVH